MSLRAEPLVHPRFDVIGTVGAGGYGTVFEAYDRERGERVALKRLHRSSPRSLSAFKREFRTLTDLVHPNLPRLHELFVAGGETFFSMELVDGVELRAHFGRLATRDHSATRSFDGEPPNPRSDAPDALPTVARPELRDIRRVVDVLAGVLGFIHGHGLVHCDVKPSNVRVATDGRIVLLDFGLARPSHEVAHAFAGTLAYAAPEQMAGELGAAIDLYALGCLVFELTTGAPPFGTGAAAAENKQRHDAPRVRLPPEDADLAELLVGLLSRAPGPRAIALERFRRGARDQEPRAAGRFLGRSDVIARIDAALDETRRGIARVIRLEGASGMGKTAVLTEIERRVQERAPGTLVLRGRASESEHVPWNLFDGVAEGLARHDHAMAPSSALGEAFPALREHASTPASSADLSADFRHLLASLGPLVLLLDDVHRADADSRRLLAAIVAEPAPPLLLLLATWPGPQLELRREVETIRLEPLSLDDARTLLSARGADADALARESQGHPLFVEELLRAEQADARRSLDDVLRARVERLSPRARRVFDAIVLATEPMTSRALADLLGEDLGATTQILDELVDARFVRRADGAGHVRHAPYHDRLTAMARGALTPETARLGHAGFAAWLERTGGAAEALCHHLEGAGRAADAARFAILAADHARAAMAFEREAALIGEALRLAPATPDERRALRLRRAEAFRKARLSLTAANELLAIAHDGADGDRALRISAARLLVAAGELARGKEVLSSILSSFGDTLPGSPRAAALALVRERALLKLELAVPAARRGGFDPDRLAALRALAEGLGMVDTLRAAVFHARAVRLALRATDPAVKAELLSIEAIFVGNAHRPGRRAARALMERALAPFRGDVPARVAGFADAVHAMNERSQRPSRANLERFKRAEGFFVSLGEGDAWVVWSLRLSRSRGARILGDLNEMRAFYYPAVAEALAQQDAYAHVTLRRSHTVLHLAADEPRKARRQLEGTSWQGERGQYHIQDWLALEARLEADLYEGVPIVVSPVAWRRLWRSPLHYGDTQRSLHWYMRGRLLLAEPRSWLNDARVQLEVKRTAGRLAGQREGYALAMAHALLAGLAGRAGDTVDAIRRLRRVIRLAERYELASLRANAALVLTCLGERAPLTTFHHDHGVRRPAAWASIDFPSFRALLVRSERSSQPAARARDQSERTKLPSSA